MLPESAFRVPDTSSSVLHRRDELRKTVSGASEVAGHAARPEAATLRELSASEWTTAVVFAGLF